VQKLLKNSGTMERFAQDKAQAKEASAAPAA
jgi:hypothetical protein